MLLPPPQGSIGGLTFMFRVLNFCPNDLKIVWGALWDSWRHKKIRKNLLNTVNSPPPQGQTDFLQPSDPTVCPNASFPPRTREIFFSLSLWGAPQHPQTLSSVLIPTENHLSLGGVYCRNNSLTIFSSCCEGPDMKYKGF